MKIRANLPMISLLALFMQTSALTAFQRTPSIVASSMKCNSRTGDIAASNFVSSVFQQQQQRRRRLRRQQGKQSMLLLSNPNTSAWKELNYNKEQRPTLKLSIFVATAAFASIFKKSAPAHAAAAVVPTSPPFLGITNVKNILLPIKVNRGSVIFLFSFSALALLAATTAFVRSIGDRYVPRLSVIEEKGNEKSNLDLGLSKEIDWGEYSHSIIEPLSEKKTMNTKKGKRFSFDVLNLFERVKAKGEVDRNKAEQSRLKKANESFLEQKYKLHHHPVHVSHSRYEEPTYLQSLAVNILEKRDVPKDYLDTLSTAKLSTWDAYQHQLDKVNPASEVDALKQGVSNLQDLIHMEQSMYHTSNHVLKLAIDAHHDEMQHVSTHEELKEFDERLSIQEELKAFDKKAMEYDEIVMNGGVGMTMENLIPNEEDCKVTNFPV